MLRLLSIGHSYCVGLNRRLAHEMAREGAGRWEVTAVGPAFFHGDLRPIRTEPLPLEAGSLSTVNAFLTRSPHMFFYSANLRRILHGAWDLVHCWEEPYVLAGWQVARWTPNDVPWVFWTMQNIDKSYPPPFSSFENYCVNRCAGWIACGVTTQTTALGRGYESKPHRVISLGVDTEEFRPDRASGAAVRRSLGWTDDGPPVVGFLGRLVEQKGLALLTRALDALGSRWRALLIGTGPMEQALREWGKSHGDRVRVATNVRHDEASRYLNAMDVLCAPSQTTPRWREQFGRMLVEAFACGVAVIGSDSGEIPFVVRDAGAIVGESDEAGWTEAIGDLLENPRRRSDLAGRGLDLAHTEYAWPVIARRHLDFFDELLEGPGSASMQSEVSSGVPSYEVERRTMNVIS